VIARDCREWAKDHIQPGVRVRTILETVEAMIEQRGAKPGFPAQSSRNSTAAHYCSAPDDELRYEQGDCVKVDIGVHVDGYIADTATTVDLSPDGRWQGLIDASAGALDAAIASITPGIQVGRIGAVVESTIAKGGFSPVRNLTGHGLARWKVHTPPQIPNYDDRNPSRLEVGMVFAIEPFASTGRGMIQERGRAEVFMMVRPPRKARGLDRTVLREIESWRGLPIARRYFNHLDPSALEDTISKLARQGSLMRYPPLVEADGVMVAQTEHSLYLGEGGVEILTA